MSPAMTMTARDRKVHDYVFKSLRLTNVRAVVKEGNPDWTSQQVKEAENWYRNFLWLAYRLRRSRQVLGIEPHADQFWHAHILDTEDYEKVCRNILGRRGFLHHKPPRGARKANARIQRQSQIIYEQYQGELVITIRGSIGPFVIPCFWHLIFG